MMIDIPKAANEVRGDVDGEGIAGEASAARASRVSMPVDESSETIDLVEETLTVSKQRKSTGSVRVSTHTEFIDAKADVELDRTRVEVTRVPVGRVVDEAPVVRTEGDTTIVPVIEERFVVIKQLFLVEELRVRQVREQETVSEPVTLRRQRAVVEHLDVDGKPVDRDEVQSD